MVKRLVFGLAKNKDRNNKANNGRETKRVHGLLLFCQGNMLEELRKTIDEIDSDLLILLSRRAEAAKKIGTVKLNSGLPLIDEDREAEILGKIVRENEGVLDDEAIARIYRAIINESRRVQFDLRGSVYNKL